MLNFALLFLFGIGVGVLSGLLGIGGGVVLVPGLVLLFGFSQSEAQGTSLAVLSLPILLAAAFLYYQDGAVRLPAVGWIALGIVVGAFLGARLVTTDAIPPAALRIAFGAMLLYVGFMFVLEPSEKRIGVALPAGMAALVLTFVGWLLRRKLLARRKVKPPGDDLEYHL